MLKRYHRDGEDPDRNKSKCAPPMITTQFDKKIDGILADQVVWKKGVPSSKEYLIRWKGEEDGETSWEREDALWQFKDEIRSYEKDTTRTS